MKQWMVFSALASSMLLLSACTLNSGNDTMEYQSSYNTGYYNTYTVGYEGLGGYGTYGSYTPAYWGSTIGYYPRYRNYGWSNGSNVVPVNQVIRGRQAVYTRTGSGGHWGRR